MRISTISLISASIIAAAGTLASADTIDATFNGVGPGEAVSVGFGGTINTTAGAFNWTRTGGTLAGFSPTFISFCIDLTQYVSGGGNYSFETFAASAAPTSGAGGAGGMGAARANQMARMYSLYYNSLTTADQFAGFQLAVWEIALDGDMNLGTGPFTLISASPLASANAATYLTGAQTPGDMWPIFAIDDPSNAVPPTIVQGQMLAPTPGAAALMGLGGLALGRRRRA